MAGVMMNPVQAAGSVDVANGRTLSQSRSNNTRISAVVDWLLAHIRGGLRNDNNEIGRLCLSLSRRIDYAIGNNEIPDRASELPNLLKQVCQWRNDPRIQAAIMVLMISMKCACRNGWFGEKDNEELRILWNEVCRCFCTVRDMNSGENTVHHRISTVLTRFYPRMKMGEILAFIETMPGYGAIVKDFQITKNPKSTDEGVYLFVAQTDATETSLCITSPQLVNFLLNGKAVNRRTCLGQDPGPQFPTLITDLVKDGTNLLQVVGQFNGKYIIVVAFMSMVSNPSCPVLPDYVPPVAAASDSDNEIVEGPSIISLNCPISFRRITTPVKGHLCKHLQSFDFDNYVDINSRRPSWRCPHCSQSVCYTDIRIDQVMAKASNLEVKVLKEVDATVSHVKISADGSWKAVNECDDHEDKQKVKSHSHQEPTPPSNMGRAVIMDLTEGDNDIDAINSHQENEKKPSPNLLQNQPNPSDQTPIHVNTNHVHIQNSPHMDNRFYRPTLGNVTSDTRSHITNSQGQTVISGSNMHLPTHAIRTSNAVMNPILQGQSQTQVSASSMQFQHGMSMMSNDYGLRYTTPNSYPTRNPNAVLAFPAQNPSGVVRSDSSRFQMDQHEMMFMMAMSENMGSQNRVHHDFSNVSSQQAQQFGAHLGPSHQSTGHQFNPYQHQSGNHMIPNLVQSPAQLTPQVHRGFVGHTVGQVSNQVAHHYVGPVTSPISNQQSHDYVGPVTSPISNQQAHHYVGPMTSPISNQQTHHYANTAAPQAPQISSWSPPIPAALQTSVSSMPVTPSEVQRGLGQAVRTQEGSANAPADQNWRPTGRMRGSLSGQAYSEAFNQSILPPTQPVQAASPPVLNTPRPFIPPHLLQVLVANNINANGFEEGADGSVLDGVGSCWSFP
ncbi:hypothetical protein SSX86_012074 [Deinandra increscens subsp. villosa]|uniref:SP-RING-type domain-containing protein n=1 Tax=Deinandra increscens subsp. villosa TaxID=3103831 RepID=A0AAP0GYF2_9ASTR